jgi:hypothetical protein
MRDCNTCTNITVFQKKGNALKFYSSAVMHRSQHDYTTSIFYLLQYAFWFLNLKFLISWVIYQPKCSLINHHISLGLSPSLIGRARPRRAPVDLGATMEDTSHKDAASVENRIEGGRTICHCQGSRGGGTRHHRKWGDLSPLPPRTHRLVCL